MQLPKHFLKIGFANKISQKVLLLGTKGRKTGKLRVTPLQYEYFNKSYFIGSMRGKNSDWVRNIINNPIVIVRIGTKESFVRQAKIIGNIVTIQSFLRLKLSRNPRMVSIILALAGIKNINSPDSLSSYSATICLVKVVKIPVPSKNVNYPTP
jgi:deazaflavin-dependent oxidoreductase (nitroreductase family)